MAHKATSITAQECVCAIVFDEMSLKTALHYDSIVAYENYGEFGCTHNTANHVLVVMARGLYSHWKQPLAYFYVSNSTAAERLKQILEKCLKP